jgi:4-diphosphocytidyl-2-C-methyl-D-erythritol kinase
MPLTLPSFAKVNLYLEVFGKRADGFHEIFTILQTVSLCDELTFELREGGIELTCDDARVPLDRSNLIIRAANAVNATFGVAKGAAVRLRKNVPIGGGLGGGSSNAAVALIGLCKLWGITATKDELRRIATAVGSDVPFFLEGGTAIGSSRGECIESVEDFHGENLVIVTPDVSASTAKAYSDLNAPNLTNKGSNRILDVSRAAELLRRGLKNDFEKTVFAAFPEIGRAKNGLTELGAKQALMSGSGASVFGIFDNEETRQTALKALGQEANWRSFAVAAVSRKEYCEKLGL